MFSIDNFLNNYKDGIHDIFQTIPLNHKFDFTSQVSVLETLEVEINFSQKTLSEIGSEEDIRKIYQIICYANYLEAIEQRTEVRLKYLFSNQFLQDFIHKVLKHQELYQRDKEQYLKQRSSNIRFYAEGKRIEQFIELLNQSPFDGKKFNYSHLFLILFWAKLEVLVKGMEGFVKIIKIQGFDYHLIQHSTDTSQEATSLLNLYMLQDYKECINCYRSYHYFNPMFLNKNSEMMLYLESFGQKKAIKNTQVKGGISNSITQQKIRDATLFFWKRCIEYKPDLMVKTFSESLYCAYKNPKNKEISSIEEIKKFIINLEEKEKLEILRKSTARPDSVAKRLGEILKNLSSDC